MRMRRRTTSTTTAIPSSHQHHEHLDFTVFEALDSWTLACVVAVAEESMFEWISSITTPWSWTRTARSLNISFASPICSSMSLIPCSLSSIMASLNATSLSRSITSCLLCSLKKGWLSWTAPLYAVNYHRFKWPMTKNGSCTQSTLSVQFLVSQWFKLLVIKITLSASGIPQLLLLGIWFDIYLNHFDVRVLDFAEF